MPYDEYLAERISNDLDHSGTSFYTKKMMGGLVFFVDGKMLCGIHIDKKLNDSLLMLRIGEQKFEQIKNNEEVLPMDFTGRSMKGYAFVTSDGFDLDEDLSKWIQYCLDFNPLAKASKSKKK